MCQALASISGTRGTRSVKHRGIPCGGHWDLAAMQAMGQEAGSVARDGYDIAALMAQAQALLQ